MDRSFLDPLTSNNGEPYGPQRYREIVRECAYISDTLHTSYADVLDISYVERVYLLQYIQEKNEATRKAMEEARARAASN